MSEYTLILVLLFSASAFGQAKKTRPDSGFIPVSVWYSGGKARAPMLSTITENSKNEWRTDLKHIKSLGFNTVRTWVEWAHCEPRRGEYHFENLNLLCELAQQEKLRVFIQLYVDSAPDWVGKNYPDSRYEAQNGAKVKSQAAPGFCTDHKGVRTAVENFLMETAKIANQYPNFYGWDLWSEPHIVNWAYINYVPNVQFCYCAHTQARFRDWLKNKYTSLATLNKAWYRNFENWNEVEPPRFGTILSYTDFIDWKNFIYEKLAGDLRMRYEAIRQIDKSHVITSHAAVPSIFYSPYNGYGATDDFLMAEQIDYYGTSLYPKHNHPDRHWELWKFSIATDFSRSANRKNGGFYVGELQAGKGTIGLNIGNPITPEDHRFWMWSALSKGAKAINIYAYYPMSSGYESGGYGLINLDGSITERAQKAGQIAGIIDKYKDLFLKSKPVQSQIAVVYNPLAQMVGGEQRHSTGDMHYNSLVGYYRFFYERNIPMDFIHRRDLENGDISPYKMIIVPYPLMFTQSAADGLKRFIEKGGHVVAESRLAWNDERGFAATRIPGMGLDAVFSAIESRIEMRDSVAMRVVPQEHPATSNLNESNLLKGAYFAESLELKANAPSQVLATLSDGSPAIVASSYGKGETILIGSFLGLANHPESNVNNNQFLLNLLRWANIDRPVTCSHDSNPDVPVEVRLHENKDGYILFVMNHSQAKQTVEIKISQFNNGQYQLHEIVSNKTLAYKANRNAIEFMSEIESRDVEVWNICGARK